MQFLKLESHGVPGSFEAQVNPFSLILKLILPHESLYPGRLFWVELFSVGHCLFHDRVFIVLAAFYAFGVHDHDHVRISEIPLGLFELASHGFLIFQVYQTLCFCQVLIRHCYLFWLAWEVVYVDAAVGSNISLSI